MNGSRSIPYGFDVSGCGFDQTTALWIKNNQHCGLTCATFIMDVFSAQGHNIFDETTWELRKSDEDWKFKMLELLMDSPNVSDEHVEYQLDLVDIYRFRPEEVAGAVPQSVYPVPFENAKKYSLGILNALESPY